MKRGFSVYLSPELMAQLTAFAKRERQSKSLVAETAIVSFLTPDDADRREAAVARRLDQLTRQIDRLERDLTVSVEALTLFIRFWLTVTPPLPPRQTTLEELVGARLLVWVGAAALALAGAFLVKISFERGWISPPVRVSGAAMSER